MAIHLSESELRARLTLHSLPSIGSKRFLKLVNYFGSASEALSSQSHWYETGIPKSCQLIDKNSVNQVVEDSLAWIGEGDQQLVCWDSDNYSALLKEIVDFPPLLFVKGTLDLLNKPQLAIVGSRHASKPGLDTTFQFAKSLATAGFVITSGLALGIDGAAHSGALAGGGGTIAVLGCGLHHMYPASHKRLARDIVENNGLLLSEFPLATAPQSSNFPRRNRIISGLSLGTLVVEASLSSGSLITAKLAAEQGRDVFAIPGSIHYPGSKGCHQLIREGAFLVEGVEHILEALQGWKNITTVPQEFSQTIPEETNTSPLLLTLKAAPQTSEALAISLHRPFEEVLIELMELELQEKVSCEAGLWYA